MLDTIPVPADSKFGAMVARRLNASRPIAPAGSLAMSGPTGSGFAALPENRRERSGIRLPKPFDIETRTDEETGETFRVIVRCAISNEGLTVLEDWSDFPELEEGETATVFLRYEKAEKTEAEPNPPPLYEIVAKTDGDDDEEEDEGELATYYPLYKIDASGKILVDYRDAFVRPFSIHTDERSIGQQDHPDYPTVLSLSHFYDNERNMTLAEARAAAQLTRNCDLVVRIVADPSESRKVVYIPLLDLLNLINSSGGGGGGGGGGGEEGEDPDGPNETITDWIRENVVTSLNTVKGDLVLSLSEGWLEILKADKAVKSVGTVTTSVSGLIGDMAVIGGNKISVTQEGNSLRISYDEEKTGDDINPFEDEQAQSDVSCDHPGNNSTGIGGGGGGVDVKDSELNDSGGGGGCCSSQIGGQSTTGGTATGSPEQGASGKPVGDATGGGASSPGKEVTSPPSSGASGTASGSSGKEIRPGSMEATMAKSKTPIYTGTHTGLTNTKKMNTSPFAKDPNWKGGIGSNAKTPIYNGTHTDLTDTKKINESPFKSDPNWKGGIGVK